MLLIVNAFNLVDVADGLLIVVGCLAAIGLLGGSFLTSPLNRVECEVVLGTLVAVFWFNRPPARVYLGDAGALPLGFLLASLFLVGFSESSDTEGFAHHRGLRGSAVRGGIDRARTDPRRLVTVHRFRGSLRAPAPRASGVVEGASARGDRGVRALLPRVVFPAVARHPRPGRRRSRDRVDRRGGRRISILLASGSAHTRRRCARSADHGGRVDRLEGRVRSHSISARRRSTPHASGKVTRRQP